ncbi:PREDICTED: protein FAM133-like isoform X2 [Cyphomyrmex costatus]|uniref:protein FAM133-like isoform X2 n=1 Tax=Cyphomyrmex costatus TaxID=456900 RepID=UPI0008523D99|nr:PREDICTED: protein FAM133-like isoform X2 [Cyphomyrmex costatus]
MPRQCHNPKCIGSKKRLTRKYKNKEKDPRPPSTSRRDSSDNSTSRNKRAQKSKLKRSKDNPKNLSFNESRNYKNKKRQVSQSTSKSSTSTYSSQKLRTTNTFGRVSGNSRDCKKQICTCHKEHRGAQSRNSDENSRSTDPVKRNKRRRKRSRRRHKKTSKRESNRPRRDCFVTLCACVRGCSSDELRACKCEILSHCECCAVKGKQEETKRVICKNSSKNDTQVGRYTANPSTSKRKSALKHSRELSAAKPNEEQSVIIRGLDTVRREIDRFSAFVIKWVTRQQ